MGGGLLQLVAYGAQDIYLTGNPQITFFKVVYRRHTNFSIECKEQVFNGEIKFGGTIDCNIDRSGDLLSNMYLEMELPTLKSDTDVNQTANLKYVNGVGHAIIKDIQVQIGGQLIDKHYAEWLNIWGELNIENSRLFGYKEMIGYYDTEIEGKALSQASSLSINEYRRFYVPLIFWFNRNPGLALPLIALQYHEVRFVVNLRKLNEIVVNSGGSADEILPNSKILDTEGNTPEIKSMKLLVDYIYLDTDERRRFAQVSHEYLIEQLQFTGGESISEKNTGIINPINLNHPIKDMHWIISRDVNTAQNTLTGNNVFNYRPSTYTDESVVKDVFTTGKLMFNGHDRFPVRNADYFRLVQPFQHYPRTHNNFIYSYAFGLRPSEHQPSGTCNFSRVDSATLNLTFDGTLQSEGDRKIKVYATNYNVLRIMSGMAGLAYSN